MNEVPITKYIKSREVDIVTLDPVSGSFAYATDTGDFYVCAESKWVKYKSKTTVNSYVLDKLYVGTPARVVPGRMICHIDVSGDYNHQVFNSRKKQCTDGESVSLINNPRDSRTFEQPNPLRQPVYTQGLFVGGQDEDGNPVDRDGLLIPNYGSLTSSKEYYAGDDGDFEGDFTMIGSYWLPPVAEPPGANEVTRRTGYIRFMHGGRSKGGSSHPAAFIYMRNTITKDSTGLVTRFHPYAFVQGGYVARSVNRGWQNYTDSALGVSLSSGASVIVAARWTSPSRNTDSTYSNSTMNIYVGGGGGYKGGSTPYAPMKVNNLAIGEQSNHGGFGFGELMMFNTYLSDSDVNTLGEHMSLKWGAVWTDI